MVGVGVRFHASGKVGREGVEHFGVSLRVDSPLDRSVLAVYEDFAQCAGLVICKYERNDFDALANANYRPILAFYVFHKLRIVKNSLCSDVIRMLLTLFVHKLKRPSCKEYSIYLWKQLQ